MLILFFFFARVRKFHFEPLVKMERVDVNFSYFYVYNFSASDIDRSFSLICFFFSPFFLPPFSSGFVTQTRKERGWEGRGGEKGGKKTVVN